MLRLKRVQNWSTDMIISVWAWTSRHVLLVIAVIALGLTCLWGPTVYAKFATQDLRYDLNKTGAEKIPAKDVAIVFGAGIDRQGAPTPYLQWRIETAVKLYKAGRVKKLLMTGDNSRFGYNEPLAMREYAVRLDVPNQDIIQDYAGFNTYDSCYRAKAIFDVKSAIVVTQGYHLPRAVLACNRLGVPSIGVAAIPAKACSWSIPLLRGCDWSVSYIVREWLSTDKIVVQLLLKPQPTLLGKPEPIRL